ncbi:MAG: hypothetical protein WA419_20615 [Silvibacterium sp.]
MTRSTLLFYVPALFTTLLTIGIGGILAAIAWLQVLLEPPAEAPRRIETGLLALTGAVVVDVIAMPAQWGFSDAEKSTVWFLLLMASFAFAIASRYFVRRNSGPGRRLVKIGANILIVCDFLGLLGIISGLPKL